MDNLNMTMNSNETRSKKKPVAVFILLAIVVIAAVVGIIFIVGNNKKKTEDYEIAVNRFMDAFLSRDAEEKAQVMLTEDMLEYFVDSYLDVDIDDYYDACNGLYELAWDYFEDQGELEYTYEIVNAENIEELDEYKKYMKELGVKDLEDFAEVLEIKYDIDPDDITDVYIVEVKYLLELDGDKLYKGKNVFGVYQYDGEWYAIPMNSVDGPTVILFLVDYLDSSDCSSKFYDKILDYVYDNSDVIYDWMFYL